MGDGALCVEVAMDALGNETNNSNNISGTELKGEDQFVGDVVEMEALIGQKQVKEASNEDMKSEVLNPVISPKGNASSGQDITSQLAQVGSGEVTSVCSGDLSQVETVSDEGEPSIATPACFSCDDASGLAETRSRVTLEIPEHASTTGIRKITFRLSKRKDERAIQMPPVHDGESGVNYTVCINPIREELEVSYDYLRALNIGSLMSTDVVPSNYPTNVKKLLSTGILDGARVKYISRSQKRELDGVVNVGGYLCSCPLCGFSKVLSAYEFEQHAGAKTKHPNNHIYLENGKPIYNIIQVLKTAPLSLLDEVIKEVAGSALNEEFFPVWKASLQQSNMAGRADKKRCSHLLVSQSTSTLEASSWPSSSPFVYNDPMGQQRNMDSSEGLKRASKRPGSYISSSVAKQKKTSESSAKRRDNDLHRLLFMPNGLPDGAELAYYVKGQKVLAGYKQGNGIVCGCCDMEISPSQFEAHAGMAARRQPYRHIYTSNGLTLHDIAVSLVNGQNIMTGVSDDMCAKCGAGGDLIFCKTCPRAFHRACLDSPDVPEGSWHCPDCSQHGHEGNSSRSIVIRLTRVVKAPEYEVGGCAVCRSHDFTPRVFDDRTVILCDQCEKEFHVGCLRDSGICELKEIPRDKWFCCNECERIHATLQTFASDRVKMIPASLMDIISRKHVEKGLFFDMNANIQWQILKGSSHHVEDLSLLSATTAIFRECFDPIVAATGRDLIPVMVHGRNISGQEFGGMYCVLLTVNAIVVSAGLLRIFGREVAELPLVATTRDHQGKGYFQALFACMEKLLCSLSVENLVLPAAEEAESIWTRRFGFRKISDERMVDYSKYQLTIFKGTSMLEKEVPRTS